MYTDAQIKEFKKLGYDVSAMGEVKTKTRLQKTIDVKAADAENIQLSLNLPLCKELRFSDETGSLLKSKGTSHLWRRQNTEKLTDAERMELGLVTSKRPGYVYTMLPDNTKICRCCQKRKPAKYYSRNSLNQDGKNGSCKDCESLRGKSYRAEKFN